jgi:transcriptional regulator with XRE-family HTH domain
VGFTGQFSGIGRALRLLRNRCGLTQAQAAEGLGTQQPEISRWEKEEVPMNLETLERILTFYKSDLHELGALIKQQRGERGGDRPALPGADEIERTVVRALKHYGLLKEEEEPEDKEERL